MGSLSYLPRARICLIVSRVGALSYTPRAGICSVVRRMRVSFTRTAFVFVSLFVGWGISYRPRDGISHVVPWVGSHLYKPWTKICLVIRRVREFLLHALYWNLSRRSAGGKFLLHLVLKGRILMYAVGEKKYTLISCKIYLK